MARAGAEGAFANPFFRRFYAELIGRGFPRGEIDLHHLALDDAPVGYLYNLRHRDRVLSYQSGFDYATLYEAERDKRRHPGLTAHAMAIEARGPRTTIFSTGTRNTSAFFRTDIEACFGSRLALRAAFEVGHGGDLAARRCAHPARSARNRV